MIHGLCSVCVTYTKNRAAYPLEWLKGDLRGPPFTPEDNNYPRLIYTGLHQRLGKNLQLLYKITVGGSYCPPE